MEYLIQSSSFFKEYAKKEILDVFQSTKFKDIYEGNFISKLDIKPMKVGFEPIAAYDKEDDKVYVGIKIDKKAAYEELRELIGKALGFAVSRGYVTNETVSLFIAKAGREEIALNNLLSNRVVSEAGVSQPASQSTEEKQESENQTESAGQPAESS